MKAPFLYITGLTLVNRGIIFLVAYLGYLGVTGQSISFLGSFQDIWGKWDTRHYLNIAEHGYQSTGEDKFLIVFYPLYPLAIRLIHPLVGNYFWAGIAVSIAAFVAATYVLYRLVEFEFNDAKLARDAVKYLLIFPFTFFFSIAYTESLFLLLTVLTFYYCRRGLWFAAGITGMLAAMTRNHGILLLLPLAVEMINHCRRGMMDIAGLLKRAVCLALVPLGLAVYLGINKYVTGDWFTFLRYQREHWHNNFGFFIENLQNIFVRIFEPDVKIAVGTWLPEFVFFIVAVLFIASAVRKVAPSYIIYSIAYLIISYSPTWLLSGPRYLAALFPLFIFMALYTRDHPFRQQVLDMSLMLLLGLYTVLFTQSLVL